MLAATPLLLSLLAVQTSGPVPNQLAAAGQLAGGYAGTSVALSGDTLASGAPGSERVYVFTRGPGGWSEQAVIGPPATYAGSEYGQSVALEGDTLVVAADGEAHVWQRSGAAWGHEAALLPPAPASFFGWEVALSGDTVVVGAPGTTAPGEVHVFERAGGTWTLQVTLGGSLAPAAPQFGRAVELRGDRLFVGSPTYNQLWPVHLFEREAGAWVARELLDPPTGAPFEFGQSLATLGDELAVGAGPSTGVGAAYVYREGTSGWSLDQELQPIGLLPSESFGTSVALAADLLVVGSTGTSAADDAVYGFRRSGGAWVQALRTEEPYENLNTSGFGSALAVAGQTVAAGAPRSGLGPFFGSAGAIEYVATLGGLVATSTKAYLARPNYQSVELGPLPTSFSGLAWDEASGFLWGALFSTNELWRVNPFTFDAVFIGSLTLDGVRALAWTPYGLYGLDNEQDQLVTINTSTAKVTKVGPLGFDKCRGLAWDKNTETFYACNKVALYTVDRTTGAGTKLGPLMSAGEPWYQELTFDPVTDTLYGIRDAGPLLEAVWEIDPVTLVQTPWDPIYLASSGSVFTLDAGEPLSYCTAGTSASGCSAAIATAGVASASAPSGFDLLASGVEGSKRGLFFYGTAGRQAAPWGNSSSFQCVVPPVRRTTLLQETGTSGACDGAFAFDLNAWFQAKPAANPGAGQLVQAQFWYRDPFAPTNVKTSLSDALEFALAP